uniref:Uncharacterized protein n=1 Tax=Rhizophora mucronata TaxID=61149 RepID=A0A2P2N6Y6_RHIMU
MYVAYQFYRGCFCNLNIQPSNHIRVTLPLHQSSLFFLN